MLPPLPPHWISFCKNTDNNSSIEKYLDLFCRLDDHDVMVTIKNWSLHPDKILSTLCRLFSRKKLLKVKLQAEPFDKPWLKQKLNEACEKIGH